MNQQYINAVRLLIDIAPVIFESPDFAMKGGTALNHLNRAFYALDSGIPIHDKIFISDSNANDHLITAGDVSFLLAPHRMLESDTTECEETGLEISGP